jgi:peptide/nickel transport system permease protein
VSAVAASTAPDTAPHGANAKERVRLAQYIIRRGIHFIFILFAISVIVFVAIRMAPGDPIVHLAGPFATAAQRAQIKASYGLDQPLPIQYLKWLEKAVQGNLGLSMQLHVPVWSLLADKLLHSVLLILGSIILAIVVGWGLGIASGLRPGSTIDRISQVLAISGISLPAFWFGMLLVIAFAIKLPWFPASGIISDRGNGGSADVLWHLILPALATAALPAGIMIRLTRSTIIEITRQPFVNALKAKGLPNHIILLHIVRNAMPVLLNMTGMQAGFLLTADIFTEVVFSWPGLGYQIYAAIIAQDYMVVQGAVLFVCVIFVALNIIVDVLRPLFDPRIRLV